MRANCTRWSGLQSTLAPASSITGRPFALEFKDAGADMVRAVAFDGACLRDKCNDDHTFGFELLCRFSPVMLERLEATRLQLLDVYGSAA